MSDGDEAAPSRAGRELPAADPPESPWRTLGAREVYRNRWLTVTEYAVLRPDGRRGIYGVVDPGENVTIVTLDAAEQVRLVGEFVYPVGTYLWNTPTGAVDPGETPLDAAQRELAEEAGLRADEWTPLGMYYLSPGISSQASHLYLARSLHAVEAQPEGTERITQHDLPLDEAYAAALSGEIRSSPCAFAICRVWALLRG